MTIKAKQKVTDGDEPPVDKSKQSDSKEQAKDSANAFLEAATVHEVYASKQTCKDCGAPVLQSWDSCPFCGGTTMVTRDNNPKAGKWDYATAIKTAKKLKEAASKTE